MTHPEDPLIWEQELARQEGNRRKLEQVRTQGRDADLVELAIANNLQIQGIALRHLKRYQEALEKLSESDNTLENLKHRLNCRSASPARLCGRFHEEARQLLAHFTHVYLDLNDDVSVEKYLKLQLRSAQNPEDYLRGTTTVLREYLTRNNYERAVQIALIGFEDTALNNKNRLGEAKQIVMGVYLEVFRNISWRRPGDVRRSDDPRDFVENTGLAIDADYKYGMTSPEEDDATMGTLFLTRETVATLKPSEEVARGLGYESWEALQANLDVEGYIRQQMAGGKFELAAKYLYEIYMEFGWVLEKNQLSCPEGSGGKRHITFAEVRDRLANPQADKVSSNTRKMIELLSLGYDFQKQHCSKSVS
jgi:hypothetical protein